MTESDHACKSATHNDDNIDLRVRERKKELDPEPFVQALAGYNLCMAGFRFVARNIKKEHFLLKNEKLAWYWIDIN